MVARIRTERDQGRVVQQVADENARFFVVQSAAVEVEHFERVTSFDRLRNIRNKPNINRELDK